jgi:hypothetical protein
VNPAWGLEGKTDMAAPIARLEEKTMHVQASQQAIKGSAARQLAIS